MESNKFELEQPSREEMIAVIEKQRPDMGEKLRMLLEKESFLKGKNVYGELYADRQISDAESSRSFGTRRDRSSRSRRS